MQACTYACLGDDDEEGHVERDGHADVFLGHARHAVVGPHDHHDVIGLVGLRRRERELRARTPWAPERGAAQPLREVRAARALLLGA